MSEQVTPDHEGMMDPGRVAALSDGVFAIVMTLLVFEIKLPEQSVSILADLYGLRFSLIGYVVSFALLGIYWVGHRAQFHYIRRADQNFHWLNLLFLAFSAVIPFTTRLLSSHPGQPLAIAVYGGNLILIGLSLYLIWTYATRGHRLVDKDLASMVIRFGTLRCLLAPAGYVVAIAASFIDPAISLIVFVIVPVLYILPGLHRMWVRAVESLPAAE